MNENRVLPSFTDEEKRALTARLKTAAAAQTVRRRPRLRRALCLTAAAALVLTTAAAASGAIGQALDRLYVTIEGQQIDADAVMTMNADGTATVVVSGAQDSVTITAPEATAVTILVDGDPIVAQETDPDAPPYTLNAEDGRLWLHVNGRIPVDVTDLLDKGVVFTYTDEDGAQQTATVKGTVEDYTVS